MGLSSLVGMGLEVSLLDIPQVSCQAMASKFDRRCKIRKHTSFSHI